ncbi:MAG TPA: hypothetical protein PKY82_05205 [Pyrinomonadaceae bacterium]|nr:hypothetical protein [Pyrinomonadaceae bacterium]
MNLELGGNLELVDVDVKSSAIEGRKLFLSLISEMKPEVNIDLMRLFNLESIPNNAEFKPNPTDFSAKLFLLHTKFHHLYDIDLTELGYEQNVRRTPILAYFDFIFRNQNELEKLIEESKSEFTDVPLGLMNDLVMDSAISKLIVNWKTLKSRNDSQWLCDELTQWADTWNLADDWCLDFAIDCLKRFKIDLIDKLRLPEDFAKYLLKNDLFNYEIDDLQKYWNRGKAWNYSLYQLDAERDRDYFFIANVPDYPTFHYVWKIKTDKGLQTCIEIEAIYNPLVTQPEKFHEDIEKEFWAKFFNYFSYFPFTFVGNPDLLKTEIRKFQAKLKSHIKKARKVITPFSINTKTKRSGDQHFKWLVEYQVLNKSYNQLAKEKELDRSTITEGVKGVADLIGLHNLRKYLPNIIRENGETD